MACSILTMRAEPRIPPIHLREVERRREEVPAMIVNVIRDCQGGASPWPLLLYGEAGVGKTCAALCVLDRVAGFTAFEVAAELVRKVFMSTYRELRDDQGARVFPNNIWSWWERAALVVLDDLGTREKVSDDHFDTIKMSLDKRDGKPLIITTNLHPNDIARTYDDRIASRCTAGTVVHVTGPDRRVGR